MFLIITVPVIYVYQLDPQEIKQRLSKLLSAHTHHQITFNGNLRWQLLPSIKLFVEDVTIKSKEQASKIQGQVGQLALRVNTWDLFHKTLNFEQIQLNKADLAVFLSQTSDNAQTSHNDSKSKKTGDRSIALSLNKVIVEDSTIHLKTNNKQYCLSHFSFKLRQHESSQKFDLHSDMAIHQPKQTIKGKNISLSGTINHLEKFINNQSSLIDLNMNAHLKANNLSINQLSINKISSKLSMNKGIVKASQYQFAVAEGKITGSATYDLNRDVLSVKQKLTDINTASILNAFDSQSQFMSGKLNLDWQSKTHPTNQDFLNHTQASGQLSYDNTLINLPKTLALLEAMVHDLPKLLGQSPSQLQDRFTFYVTPKQTKEYYDELHQGELTAQFKMNHGIIQPVDFLIKHPKLKATGNLTINLKQHNVLGHMKLETFSIDKTVEKAQTLLNGAFPFVIKGRFSDMKAYPDMAMIAPILARHFLKEKGKESLQQLGNQLLNKALSRIHD